jgi:hypothetical protein
MTWIVAKLCDASLATGCNSGQRTTSVPAAEFLLQMNLPKSGDNPPKDSSDFDESLQSGPDLIEPFEISPRIAGRNCTKKYVELNGDDAHRPEVWVQKHQWVSEHGRRNHMPTVSRAACRAPHCPHTLLRFHLPRL